jgi:Icc-related predicted phosphoesterase
MSETKKFEDLFLSSNIEETLSIKKLKILIISDINSNFIYLQKLKEWQLKKNIYFDYIFFLGNFLKQNQYSNKNEEKENLPVQEAEMTSLISFLENINLNIFYIGGNNDPKNLFMKNPPTLTMKSLNIHKQCVKILDDLYLIGLSGMIPQFINKINEPNNIFIKPFKKYNYENVYNEGFNYYDPDSKYYGSDKKFGKDIKEVFMALINDIYEYNTNKNIKFILMTNFGPFSSHTTFYNNLKENSMIYGGSKILESYIKKYQTILVNVHANNSLSKGIYILEKSFVVNPGNLDKGDFVIIDLERDMNKEGEWKIKKIQMENLFN